jgi:hypothetical protein
MRTIDPENPLTFDSDLIEDVLKVLAEIRKSLSLLPRRSEPWIWIAKKDGCVAFPAGAPRSV